MRTKRHNKLYNYLVNQFGITKESVWDHIKSRIEEVLAAPIEDRVHNAIDRLVREKINCHYDKRMGTYISSHLDKVITKQLDDRLKDAKFIANLNVEITPDLKIIVETPIQNSLKQIKAARLTDAKS